MGKMRPVAQDVKIRITRALFLAAALCLPAVPLSAAPPVMATIDGAAITSTEVEQALQIPLYDLEVEKYQLTRRRLEQLIVERLLERAAAARGVSVPVYVATEIKDLTAVSQTEVDALYAKRRDQAPADEERVKQEIRSALLRERASKAVQALVDRLAREGKVDITLRPPDPPVVALTAGADPVLGPPAAPVTIVEFADFECPVCKENLPILKQLQSLYPDQIRLVYRDFPIASHPQARPAAEAAHCADEQGQFWSYHDALFALAPDLKAPAYLKLAESLKLNLEAFTACLGSNRPKEAVNKDLAEARRLGLSGTPTFFVNGRYFVGMQSLETFREAVDRELQAAKNGSRARPAERESGPR